MLHEQLASWAKEDKASLNALIVGILEEAIKVHEKSVATRSEVTGPPGSKIKPAPGQSRTPVQWPPRLAPTVESAPRPSALLESRSAGMLGRVPLSGARATGMVEESCFPDSSIGRASGC